MKSTSAPTFGADLAARLQLSDDETRLVKVVLTPADGRGLSRVLVELRDSFQVHAADCGQSSARDWHQVVHAFLERVLAVEVDFPQLGHDAEPGDAVESCWLELQPGARTGARLEVRERLQGLLARAVLAAMAEGRAISSGWLATWNRLMRRPRGQSAALIEHVANHRDWSFQGITNLAEGIRDPQLSRFLAECLSAVQVATPSTTLTVTTSAPGVDQPEEAFERDSARNRASRAMGTESPDDEEGRGPLPGGLLLPILYGRGVAATLVERLGSHGRLDVYPPQALKALCGRVRAAFDSPNERRRNIAATFLTNLAAPLPLEHFLHISLHFNGDVWLDLERGVSSWSLRSLLKRRPRNFQGPDWPLLPHEIVDVPLDERALAHLRQLAQGLPDALSLRDLMVKPGEDIVNFLQAARDFLKQCGDPAYEAHWSRAVRGFGQHLRESLSDLHAVFGACDTVSTPLGILHYVLADREKFFGALRRAASGLGLRLADTVPRSADFGSRMALSNEDMARGLKRLDEIACTFLDDLGRVRQPRELALCFSAAMLAICQAIVTLTLSRGTRLERITVAQLHLHPDWVGIADKRASEDLDFRLLPSFALLEHFLALHLRLLRKFKQRCLALGQTLQGSGIDKRLAMEGDQTAFYTVEWTDRCWRTENLTTANLLDLAQSVFGKRVANAGRHFGVSRFFDQARDSAWIGMLSNHGREEAEPFGASRPVSRASMQDKLVGALDSIFPASILSRPLLRRARVLPTILATMNQQLPGAGVPSASQDPRRIIGPACDRDTILSLAICDDILTQINQCDVATPSASLVLALLVADGLQLADIEIILATPRALQGSVTEPWSATWTRADKCNTITIPLVPLTAAVLRLMGTSAPRLCLPSALEATACHLRARYPAMPWASSTQELLASVEQLARRRWRHCVPGALELSASPLLDAATPSAHSLQRLGHRGESSSANLNQIRTSFSSRRTPQGVDMAHVLQAIREAGNTRVILGEDERRFGNLDKALGQETSDVHSKAAYLVVWQRVEIKRWRRQLLGHPLDPASSVTYLRGVLRGLEVLRFDGPKGAPSAENWRTAAEVFWRECEGGTADDQHDEEDLRQLRVHWRHFLQALSQAGYAAGELDDVAEDDASKRLWEAKTPASAHLVFEQDWQFLRDAVPRRLDEMPLGQRRGTAAVGLLEAGMRRAEIAAMRTVRICSDLDAAVVTSEGASHLKSFAARRVAPLNAGAAVEIRDFKKVLDASPGASDFLFAHSDGDLSGFDVVADAMTIEMVMGTGEAAIRVHSGRGSVLMDLHHPNWECVLRGAYGGTLTEQDVAHFVASIRKRGLSHIGKALVQAGQAGVLTPSVHYLSIWPAIRHVWLRHALCAMEPSPKLLRRLGRYDAMRKARERCSDHSFSAWDWLNGSMPVGGSRGKRKSPAARPRTPAKAVKPQRAEGPPRRLRDVSHVKLVRLAMVVVLQEDCDVVADALRLDAASKLLAQSWADSVSLDGIGESDDSSVGRMKALRKLVRTPACAALIDALWRATWAARADLLEDLSPFDGRLQDWRGSGDAVARISRHLGALPDDFSLQVRFGKSHPPAEGWGRLTALKPRLILDKSEEGRGPRPYIAIRVTGHTKDSVTASRWSTLARLALAVVERAKSSQPEED